MIVKTPVKSHFVAWFYLTAYTVLGGMAVTGLVLLKGISIVEVLALGAAVVLFLAAILHWIHFYFFRFVVSMELEECWRIRTLMGERVVPWSEIGRFVLMSTGQPVTGVRIVNAMLTDGFKPAVWLDDGDAEALWRLVASKPWARDWAGRQLSSGIAIVALVLGLLAMTMGLVVAVMLINYNFVPAPHDSVRIDYRLQMMAAIGGPLVGTLGLAFGGYHLIRRPIFYRPGVVRSDDTKPTNPIEWVTQLFTRPE